MEDERVRQMGRWHDDLGLHSDVPRLRPLIDGFYSAASDYFTHIVGPGFDYHCDLQVEPNASTVYTTHKVTSSVQAWITSQVTEAYTEGSDLKTFAYVAHEAVHGPMEVPQRYIDGACAALVPADHPTRKIYCGMVRAVDESVKNISDTYAALGLMESTLFILTGDNGGIPQDGGNNFPLRGNKATTFEGGIRSIAFISGAGLAPAVRGSVSHGLMHIGITDWLPPPHARSRVALIDLSGNATGRACPTCTRPVAPLDGVNQWPMLSSGAPSRRNEVLLDLVAEATAAAHTCSALLNCAFFDFFFFASSFHCGSHSFHSVSRTIRTAARSAVVGAVRGIAHWICRGHGE